VLLAMASASAPRRLLALALVLAAAQLSFFVSFVQIPRAVRQRDVAASATRQKKASSTGTPKKTGKYRGQVNPRLRSFLQSNEYRELLSVLNGLNEQGLLDEFLDKAEKYWMDINIFQLAMQEQDAGGKGVVATVKKDWPRIWPAQMEGNRMYAFECFTNFWTRLERSKLVEDIMKDVLPDMSKGYSDKLESKDQQLLMKLSDEERRDEIMNRLGSSPLVAQYGGLSKEDAEVKAIGGKMAPFIAKFVSILERKVSTQTEALGQTVDYAVVAVIAVVLLIALSFAGVIQIPDPTW